MIRLLRYAYGGNVFGFLGRKPVNRDRVLKVLEPFATLTDDEAIRTIAERGGAVQFYIPAKYLKEIVELCEELKEQ